MIIVDESLAGERLNTFSIASLDEKMNVREIIRARIWQEVQDYNSTQRSEAFRGLVAPSGTSGKVIDWEIQYDLALRGFESNGFFMLIGNRQAESLDEIFLIQAETEVSFVKFVPLVGG